MEKFKKYQLVEKIGSPRFIILTSWGRGDHFGTFQGTVVQSDNPDYPIGEHSRTWHEDKFELCKPGTICTIESK